MEKPSLNDNFRKEAESYLDKQGGRLQEYAHYTNEELLHELQVHQIELELQNDELKNSQLKLQEERAKYTSLFNLAPVGYFNLDKQGFIKDMNYSAEHMLGREVARSTDSKFTDFIYPEDQDLFYFHFQDILKYGKGKPREIRLIKPDKSNFYVRIQSTTIKNSQQGMNIFMAVIDITEMVEARNQLKAAKVEAEAASRAKSQFLANMSHEIRTPMNGILGMLEIAMMADLPDEQKEHLRLAKSSADNLLSILNDILDLSKIEAKKLTLQEIEFNPAEVISGAARLLSVSAWRNGVELVAGVDPKIPKRLIGDPLRLKQVLYNLLSNAVKFTGEGEIQVQIARESGAPPGKERLKFVCRDSGIGIDPKHVERLFQTFTQADEATTRKYGGTGLGLAISAKLIEMMGGSIHVDSAEGRGSTFSFVIDLAIGKGVNSETAKAPEDSERASVKQILLAEAHESSRRVFNMYFEDLEVPVYPVSPGKLTEDESTSLKEKITRVGEPEEQLVLISGKKTQLEEFLEFLDKDPLLSRIPIVIAGYPPESADYRNRFSQYNVHRVIEKPIDYNNLSDMLHKVFNQKLSQASTQASTNSGDSAGAIVTKDKTMVPTILIAEDNDINMKVLDDYFSKKQWKITKCRNGKEALEQFILRPASIDAVLMDIQMPVMDGYEAITKLRNEAGEAGARVPIIAMTAYAMSSDRERCYRVGANDYVTKPISSMEKLEALLEQNMQKHSVKQHIVIAEDENINRMFLHRILDKAGYQVSETKDGEGALSLISEELPHMAILDLQLPKKNGITVINELCANEKTAAIPVIIISGRSYEEIESEDLPENVVGIITKPVDRSTLLEYIENNLRRKAVE